MAGNYMLIAEKQSSLMLGFVDIKTHYTISYCTIYNHIHFILLILILYNLVKQLKLLSS